MRTEGLSHLKRNTSVTGYKQRTVGIPPSADSCQGQLLTPQSVMWKEWTLTQNLRHWSVNTSMESRAWDLSNTSYKTLLVDPAFPA